MTLVGMTLGGRYVLERRVGQGGSSDVYRARDTRLDRLVSVKILNDEWASDPTFRNRLAKEAKSVAALTHPGIVRILDAGEAEIPTASGRPISHTFIVMEYVQGIELAKVIAKGPLKVAEALRISKEVADGLAFAHGKGIVHRDVTSNNIMVTKSGTAKVLDFGIASTRSDADPEATQALNIVGTPAYFSPEQANGEAGDERSDIYSLGVVLFEMLTGRVPFPGDDSVAMARSHLNDVVVAPSTINPKVPAQVDLIVARALSKKPEQRFATATAFSAELDAAFANITGMTIETSSPSLDVDDSVSGIPDDETQSSKRNTKAIAAPRTGIVAGGGAGAASSTGSTGSLSESESGADDAFDALFSPRASYSGGTSWSVEEMSGLGARKSPQRRRVFAGIAISLVTAAVLALVAIWVINLAPSNIIPSSGVAVPSVANMTYEQAAAKMKAANFLPVEQDENSLTVAKDKVIRTEPAAGKKIDSGSIVTIIVSLGALESPVPNIVGMTVADGTAQLTAVKLVVGSTTETYHGSYPAGTIISTDPAIGTSLKEGSVVNLVVANGKVNVPDVRGMSLKDATAKLNSPEFMIPVVASGDTSCKIDAALSVRSQSVLGEAPLGTSVTIYYCSG